jgi:hypothetical protein
MAAVQPESWLWALIIIIIINNNNNNNNNPWLVVGRTKRSVT